MIRAHDVGCDFSNASVTSHLLHQLNGLINIAHRIKRHSGQDQLYEIWSRWLAMNKIGGWIQVLMKTFIKTSDICQDLNLTKDPINYILLVRDDRIDSSCITFC
jgi:hypothetical protein